MASASSPLPATESVHPLGAFRYPDFRIFFAGLVLASQSAGMQRFAIGVLAVQLAIRDGTPEHGALYLGLIGLASLAPGFFGGIFGGIAADRFDRRRVIGVARASSAVVGGVLAILTIGEQITILHLVVLAGLQSGLSSFDAPPRFALLPRLVSPAAAFSAMGLGRMTMQSQNLVGPLLGGALVLPLGVGGVLAVCAAMWIASGLGLGVGGAQHADPQRGRPGAVESLRQGFSYAREDTKVGAFLLGTLAVAILVSPYSTLLPAVAHDSLQVGPVELSWLAAAAGVGALLGASLTTMMGAVRRPGAMLVWDLAIVAALLVTFGVQRSLLPTIIVTAAIGCGLMIFNSGSAAVVQTTVPDRLIGRVMGLQVTLTSTGQALGVLILGAGGSIVGVSNVFLVAGGATLVTAVLLARVSSFWLAASDDTVGFPAT